MNTTMRSFPVLENTIVHNHSMLCIKRNGQSYDVNLRGYTAKLKCSWKILSLEESRKMSVRLFD